MLRAISLFEIRYYLRHPLFYGTTLFLGFVMFVVMASDAIELGGAVGNVYRNAPYVLIRLMAILTILGMFVVTAFASSAYRDFDHNTHPLFFSKPIRKRDYLLGRFLGSLAITVLVFVGPALGLLLGSFMPWLDPERLGPTQLAPTSTAFWSSCCRTCSSWAPSSSCSPRCPGASSSPTWASSASSWAGGSPRN